jgi:hypothetical protein
MARTSSVRRRFARICFLGAASVSLAFLAVSGTTRAAASDALAARSTKGAPGPLVVSSANPRYFSVASGNGNNMQKIVYLAGAHIWVNLQDGVGVSPFCDPIPVQFDYPAYLDYTTAHGLNFIRMWRWEHFASSIQGAFHICASPQPWARTGPGIASDGAPRFDLTVFNQAYFDRLRARVQAAGDRGIYVGVMFFNGFCLYGCDVPSNTAGHPFGGGNNVNGVAIQAIEDYESLSASPAVLDLQKAYIRKVIDTVHDLPNVLFEVTNESNGSGTAQWQYSIVNYVKQYESATRQGNAQYLEHPVGMTWFPEETVQQDLMSGPADWVSPGISSSVFNNPPVADGTKVLIGDSDHDCCPFEATPLWVWKSFVRGWNATVIDGRLIAIGDPLWEAVFPDQEPANYALGDTLRYANMMKLVSMSPRGDLTSTGYALANPGNEYLVLQPGDASQSFSVTLVPGRYTLTWFFIDDRTTIAGGMTKADGTARTFTAPTGTSGPAVLYIKRTSD